MNSRKTLAIIGSGPSAIYFLKHLLDGLDHPFDHPREITVFEKSQHVGMGMPYNPWTTDRYHKANISSEELPELPTSFAEWLRGQSPSALSELGVEDGEISEKKIYTRLAVGSYLHDQYRTIVSRLTQQGVAVREHLSCEIVDLLERHSDGKVNVVTAGGEELGFDQIIIATGHCWPGNDEPQRGFYASPWPISKLLPAEGAHLHFTIGLLGASLSAFDVVVSLAHRHGAFTNESGRLAFKAQPGTEDFKIVMHSADGKLPHLQFALADASRQIYRHVDRKSLLALVDDSGFLRLDAYFDKVCRPALAAALGKDGLDEMVSHLVDPSFGLLDFVEKMSDDHEYTDAFEGMRYEMIEARESVGNQKPIHWKEVIDDLIYTLNFHAELMPAEDHFVLKSQVMPFLMNVIAAMPLESAAKLLAFHDAGKLELIAGKVQIEGEPDHEGLTTITVREGEAESTSSYRMFVDCSGQKPLELEDYPFPGLVGCGSVRKARARFFNFDIGVGSVTEEIKEHIFYEQGEPLYHIGGVDIDGTYRLIGRDGKPNSAIHDISFPHTSGARPYSYGLQACSDTGAILVRSWIEESNAGEELPSDTAEITRIYERI